MSREVYEVTFLISTNGPPEDWWQIKNSLSDELIEAATSIPELIPGIHNYLITARYHHGIALDEIESEEFHDALVSTLIYGAKLIINRHETPDSLHEHYQKLLTLLEPGAT
ncbi:MAG: hypothetical protein AAF711_14625 [Planctomycetota bacterium]